MRIIIGLILLFASVAVTHAKEFEEFSERQRQFVQCSADVIEEFQLTPHVKRLMTFDKLELLTTRSGSVDEFVDFAKQHIRPVCGSNEDVGLTPSELLDITQAFYNK